MTWYAIHAPESASIWKVKIPITYLWVCSAWNYCGTTSRTRVGNERLAHSILGAQGRYDPAHGSQLDPWLGVEGYTPGFRATAYSLH